MRPFIPHLTALLLGALLSTAHAESPPSFLGAWGEPGSGNGQFWNPRGVALDAAGNVYVTDATRVQKFTNTGQWISSIGSWGNGPGQFSGTEGIAFGPDGSMYVVDRGSDRIQKFTANGVFVLEFGYSSGARWEYAGPGEFSSPEGVGVDAAGNVYVTDRHYNRVQKFTANGAYLLLWGAIGFNEGPFLGPLDLAIDAAGHVFVASSYDNRVLKFDSTGGILAQWSGFSGCYGLAVDAQSNLYVTEYGPGLVKKLSPAGELLASWGSVGNGPGQFNGPGRLAIGPAGTVYVVDTENSRVQMFGPVPTPARPVTFGRVKSLYR